MAVYSDYSRDRIGWFFGLTGPQLAVLGSAALPVFIAVNRQQWSLAGSLILAWAALLVLVAVPIRGRSLTGWLVAWSAFTLARVAGWSRFRSRASVGKTRDLAEVDLPGVLSGVVIHDGPPSGPSQARVAIIQDHAAHTWAVTAAITHPGVGMADGNQRAGYGTGLADLLDGCVRTELIDEVLFIVRTVPDDAAERLLWSQRHRRPRRTPARGRYHRPAHRRPCRSVGTHGGVRHDRGARGPAVAGGPRVRTRHRRPRQRPAATHGRSRSAAALRVRCDRLSPG